MLFVLGADLLQSIINAEALNGNLSHPLGSDFRGDFPIVQYADDAFVILPADKVQLSNLKDILQSFAASTGLKVNFAKSFLMLINVDGSKWSEFTETLGCQLGQIPFTYLGLPLGTTSPSV